MIPSSKQQRCVRGAANKQLSPVTEDLRPWGPDTKFSAAYFHVCSLRSCFCARIRRLFVCDYLIGSPDNKLVKL
eukprot:400548-Prorocentrum_minimum.AAC.2